MKNITVCMLLVVICILFFTGTTIHADTNDGTEVKLDISPDGSLFDIENMKPGDWAPRTVTIENNGTEDFDYTMQLENTGKDKLFTELWLEVKVQDDEWYSGKLADYKPIESKLSPKTVEELQMTIRFPEHLGNDYQGLKTHFSFVFNAKGGTNTALTDQAFIDGMVDSGKGGILLPQTATSIFNFLLVGILTLSVGILLAVYRGKKGVEVE